MAITWHALNTGQPYKIIVGQSKEITLGDWLALASPT
jgi:hypothetical protein